MYPAMQEYLGQDALILYDGQGRTLVEAQHCNGKVLAK
jgi:hypothetical protein